MENYNVFIVNESGEIEQVGYADLVWQFVEITTSPRGVEPKLHIREADWYKVGEELFADIERANDAAAEIHLESGVFVAIENVTRYEGWTWGHQGNFPRLLLSFDTEEEAQDWLFKCAEIDFQNDWRAPMIFNTREEVEAFLLEQEEIK